MQFLRRAIHGALKRESWFLARFLMTAFAIFLPRDSWHFEVKGALLSQSGDNQAAVRFLKKAVELDVRNLSAAARLLRALVDARDLPGVLTLGENLRWRGDLSPESAYEIGVLAAEEGDFANALLWFEVSLPLGDMSQLSIGHSLLNLKRPRKAASHYGSLARSTDDSWTMVQARVGLAKSLVDSGDCESARAEALHLTDRIRELNPEDRLGVQEDVDELVAWLGCDPENESPE